MSEQVTVTYSLEEVLKELKQEIKDVNTKLDKLNTIEVEIAKLTEKVGGMDKRLEKVESEQGTMVKAISDLQGFRSLILPIVVAVSTALLTLLFRLVPNFPH
ncbi:shikimate dehydrogenase [Crocosphaera sp. XPORK-15E]|uniref:shikimate dehydrogenase n=1 Tax=Crocosphaera sp. XPORK-15E TaxID=3110247 RepID=UPI002B21CBA6|nr:shikimate dehydrogenase [Crocosphaera sp. XPORK-15E]MEA5533459.1 shikimate dehydrogenase [Crocosphaera sp. XPORK-15E]